jgi:hypothetical protein
LGVLDDEWASKLWSGLILERDSALPARIALSVYPSLPVTIRVTRGPNRTPVAGASLYVTSRGHVEWTNRAGEKKSGSAGINRWLTTDSSGEARGNVGLGPHEVHYFEGKNKQKTFEVTADKPVVVEFHQE